MEQKTQNQLKVNDLRIGNLLQRLDGSEFRVSASDFADIEVTPIQLRPKPIPITEEWSEKLSKKEWEFVGYGTRKIYQHKLYLSIKLEFSHNWVFVYFNDEMINMKEHVHELQNLYHALTNKELAWKSEK